MFIDIHLVDNRYLRTLKSYVRNKTYPEGSIAEGYLAEESTTFCSRYLNDVETKYNHTDRNFVDLTDIKDEGLIIFKCIGRSLGMHTCRELSSEEWAQAHLYVLTNCDDVIPFIK